VTACVVALVGAIVLSHLANAYLGGAVYSGQTFAKVALYYLLLVATVNTPSRLRRFLEWLVLFIAVLAVVALVQYHEFAEIPGLTTLEANDGIDPETGEVIRIPRLRATGIYNDPNDLCLVLVVGALICLSKLTEKGKRSLRHAWLLPLVLFGYAILETKSRGGFLALLAGLAMLFWARFGWRKAALLGSVALPAVFLLAPGRQASLSTSEGTSQERIQMWSDALDLFRQAPLFGVGQGTFADHAGLVAHNSFAHCFAELGFVGGTLFLGAFLCAAWQLRRLQGARRDRSPLSRLGPFLLAILVAYAVGLLSLSRVYVSSTYLILGLAVAYARIALRSSPAPRLQLNAALLGRLATASVLFLAALYVFVRISARWSA
jgi:O-antigen ligase